MEVLKSYGERYRGQLHVIFIMERDSPDSFLCTESKDGRLLIHPEWRRRNSHSWWVLSVLRVKVVRHYSCWGNSKLFPFHLFCVRYIWILIILLMGKGIGSVTGICRLIYLPDSRSKSILSWGFTGINLLFS